MKTLKFAMHLHGVAWGLMFSMAAVAATTGEYWMAAVYVAFSALSLHCALKLYVIIAEYYFAQAAAAALAELTRRMK